MILERNDRAYLALRQQCSLNKLLTTQGEAISGKTVMALETKRISPRPGPVVS